MRNERGMIGIALATSAAALVALLMILTTQHFNQMTVGYRISQGKRFSEDISNALAIKIRSAYDQAKGSICVASGFSVHHLASGVDLCLPANQKVCTPHPMTNDPVCAGLGDGTLAYQKPSKFEFIKRLLEIPMAFAIGGSFTPDPPVVTGINIVLPASTNIRCAGQACTVPTLVPVGPPPPSLLVCGAAGNADCVSYSFCPLVGNKCKADQKVIQTIAFFR